MNQLTAQDYRADARIKLSGKWGINVGISVVSFIISMLLTQILVSFVSSENTRTMLTTLLSLFVTFALSYGISYAALYTTRGGRPKMDMLMVVFSDGRYVPMLLIHLVQGLVSFLVNLVLYIPILLVSSGTLYLSFVLNQVDANVLLGMSEAAFGSLMVVIAVIFVVGIFVSYVLEGIFSMAVWAKLDFPELTAMQAILYAWSLLKDRIGKYLWLQLTFIGWVILGAFLLAIPLLWVGAYQRVTNAGFYDQAVQEKGSPQF